MEFNDMMLCGVINDTRNKLHALADGFSEEEAFLKAIEECKKTEEELKAFVTDDDDDQALHDYVAATIKMLQDLAFGIGIMMNGQGVIKSSFEKYDAACNKAIKAVEERSGGKFEDACDNLKDNLQRMIVCAFLEAMAEADGDLPDTSFQNFVDTMKKLGEEKNEGNEENDTEEK